MEHGSIHVYMLLLFKIEHGSIHVYMLLLFKIEHGSIHVYMLLLFKDLKQILGTVYDYLDLPGLGNNNEKLGLPERLSTGIQFWFRNLFHRKKSGNRNFIC